MRFAVEGTGTGLWLQPPTEIRSGTTEEINFLQVDFLEQWGNFSMRFTNSYPPSPGVWRYNYRLIGRHRLLGDLSSNDRSNVRGVFGRFPSTFKPISITDNFRPTQNPPYAMTVRGITGWPTVIARYAEEIPDSCPNGVIDRPAEECDGTGGGCNPESCYCSQGYNSTSQSCNNTPQCGDSVLDRVNGREQCDDGPRNGSPTSSCNSQCKCAYGEAYNPLTDAYYCCPAGQYSDGMWDPNYGGIPCRPACGNGVVDRPAEECDGGNDPNCNLDTCKCKWGTTFDPATQQNVCLAEPFCGDSRVTFERGEECEGSQNGDCVDCKCLYGRQTNATGGYTGLCLPRCGNRVLDAGEECDNPADPLCDAASCRCFYGLDPSTNRCHAAPFCGDGRLTLDAGEQCEGSQGGTCVDCRCPWGFVPDAQGRPSGTCYPKCGNRVVDDGEQCDDPADPNCDGATCLCRYGLDESTMQCLDAPRCGDGRLSPEVGEECEGALGGLCDEQTCRCRWGTVLDGQGRPTGDCLPELVTTPSSSSASPTSTEVSTSAEVSDSSSETASAEASTTAVESTASQEPVVSTTEAASTSY